MIGNDRMIYRRGASQSATFVVAASDSLHSGYADYVCDGVDDQVEIQAAIDLCPANAKIVTIGDLTFSAPINTKANGLTIEGAGSKWVLADGAKCSFINIDHDDTTIKNLIIDGNVSNNSYTTENYNSSIHITSAVSNLTVSDIDFVDIWNACIRGVGTVSVPIVDGFVCERCTADNIVNISSFCHGGGLVYLNHAKHVEVGSCRISNAHYVDGVKTVASEHINIHDIDMVNIGSHGVFVGIGSSHVNINNINLFDDDDFRGLEVVCVEMGGDSNIGGTPKNEYVNVNNIMFTASKNVVPAGNNGIYFGDVNHGHISNCIINVPNAHLNNDLLYLEYLYDVLIENSTLKGYFGDGKQGIYMSESSYVTILNCNIVDSPTWSWTESPHGITILYSDHINITHCLLKDIPAVGVYLTGNEDNSINIESCTFDSLTQDKYAIYVCSSAEKINVVDCAFINLLKGAAFVESTTGIFIDNRFENVTTPFVASGSTTVTVQRNIGVVTENSGTATLADTTTSIAVDHGLDITPSAGDIMVTPMGSLGSASFFYIDTYTSTQFTIHVDVNPGANVDFAWKAIVL